MLLLSSPNFLMHLKEEFFNLRFVRAVKNRLTDPDDLRAHFFNSFLRIILYYYNNGLFFSTS